MGKIPVGMLTLWSAFTVVGQPVATQVVTSRAGGGADTASVQPAKTENLGTVEGKVVNAATGEPLRKATVILHRVETSQAMMMAGIPMSYTASSDASGQYKLKNVEPGKYRMNVSRNGFTRTEYGSRGPTRAGTTLSLEPGRTLTGVDFKLTPHGVVSGRVVDEDGEPFLGAQVTLMRWAYNQGTRRLAPANNAIANDLGEFRIYGIAPGRYYLSTNANNRMAPLAAAQSDDTAEEGYLATYFPGTTDPSAASMIEIAAGQQLSGFELRLNKTGTLRVRGRIVNQTGVTNRPVMLELLPRDRGMWGFFSMNRETVGAPGKFEFRGLAPGSYVLVARVFDSRQQYTAQTPIELTTEHRDNIVFTVAPGFDVQGELRFEGAEAAQINAKDLFVSLNPNDFVRVSAFAPDGVQPNGSFTIRNVSHDNYRVSVGGQPDGYYVKSVRMDDQDGLENGLDLTAGPSGLLRIVLGPGAAHVEGTVTNDKKEPVPGATVVLRPEKEALRQHFRYMRTATSDQHGRFAFRNVDPADYRLFAWEDIESGAWMDPEMIRPVESRGRKMELKEGSRETVELPVIPAA